MKTRQNYFSLFKVSFESKYSSKSAYYKYLTREKLKLMKDALIRHVISKLFRLQRSFMETSTARIYPIQEIDMCYYYGKIFNKLETVS